jgi:hypothetical protein
MTGMGGIAFLPVLKKMWNRWNNRNVRNVWNDSGALKAVILVWITAHIALFSLELVNTSNLAYIINLL